MINKIRMLGLVLLVTSTPLLADNNEPWDWKIAPYLWGINLSGDTSIGPLKQNVDVSFSDILSNMELAGQIYAEIGRDKHAFHIDYTYLRLKPDATKLESPPFPEGAKISSKLTVNIFEPAYNYRWNGPDGPAFVVGARFTDMEIRLSPENLPAATAGPSWWDYFIGIKTHSAISTNWDIDFYSTIGTGGSDLPWTVQVLFGRRYANDNRFQIGARVWGVDYSENKNGRRTAIDLTYYGLILGYEFN